MKRIFALLLLVPFLAFADMSPIMVPPQATLAISVTGSSATTALPSIGVGEVRQVELTNGGTVTVFVEFGASTVTATVPTGTANAYPILSGQTKVVTVKPTTTHIAAIGASAGPTTLYVTLGIGQ